MAKIKGKEEQPTHLNVEDMTEEQIIALAKYTNLLQEENQNLKGYVLQLQAQLRKARGDRAVAQQHISNTQFVQTETMIKTAFDE